MTQIELLKSTKNTDPQRGPYVEFGIREDSIAQKYWDHGMKFEDSVFLEDDFYGFFSNAFQLSNKKFNYYGDTKYKTEELKKLKILLEKEMENINKISSLRDFDTFVYSINAHFDFHKILEYAGIEWKKNWEEIKKQLCAVNQGLIDTVQRCLDNNKVLWVLGV